jgi:hypothetical protein
VNTATFNDWLFCVGPAIQAEHLNGPEFACPSVACLSGRAGEAKAGAPPFFQERESLTLLTE